MTLTFGGRFKVMSTIASHSPLNISNSSETVRDRNFQGPTIGNGQRESNSHVTDDVT